MNQRIAALHLARRYPDFDSLASHMGKRSDTLRKELAGAPGYKWGVEDQALLIELCQAAGVADCLAPITAAAANAGALVVPLPSAVDESSPTFKCLADAALEFGRFMSVAAEALADGRITDNELRNIEKEFGLLVGKGQHCLANLGALNQAAKPVQLREVKAG